jgi:hypothetical protein
MSGMAYNAQPCLILAAKVQDQNDELNDFHNADSSMLTTYIQVSGNIFK